MDNDHNDGDALDVEYRHCLSIIKTVIPTINVNFYLNQYRVWLEKISCSTQKPLRNHYLRELTRQIERRNLKFPFTQTPPTGDLIPMFVNNVQSLNTIVETGKDVNVERDKDCDKDFSDDSWVDLTPTESNFADDQSKNDDKKDIVKDNDEINKQNNDDVLKSAIQNLKTDLGPENDSNYLKSDWKSTINALQLRLTETLLENTNLKNLVGTFKKRELEFKRQLDDAKRFMNELTEKKNVIELEKGQHDELIRLEELFKNEMEIMKSNHNRQLEKLKTNYKLDIDNLKSEITKKDDEIKRLNTLVQEQCVRMSGDITTIVAQLNQLNCGQNQSADERVAFLHDCILRMDKLFQRSEREYLKLVERLKSELHLKEKLTDVKFIAQQSNEKQMHYDHLANDIEDRFQKLVNIQEANNMEIRRTYEHKILRLLQILKNNKISNSDTSIK